MNSAFRFAPRGRATLKIFERVLDEAYGAPEEVLGNHPDALEEAIYIILSFQTDLARFKRTWQSLRSTFPQWEEVESASVEEVAVALRPGGLHRQKARAIKKLLTAVRQTFGELSLDSLRSLSDDVAEQALTRLPGLSWKGARCVLLYSLDRPALPIDGNTFRILQRAGVISQSAVYRRRSLHDALQEAVPLERRRRFHVNLVVHGQRTCLPEAPRCASCPAKEHCARRNVPPMRVGTARLTSAAAGDSVLRSRAGTYQRRPWNNPSETAGNDLSIIERVS